MPRSRRNRTQPLTAREGDAAQTMRDVLDAAFGAEGELSATLRDLGWPPQSSLALPQRSGCHVERPKQRRLH